jgi:hypothetical protein
VFAMRDTLLIAISNTFKRNSAYTGGAMSLQYITAVTEGVFEEILFSGVLMINSTFSDNTADDGGTIYLMKIDSVVLLACFFDRGRS